MHLLALGVWYKHPSRKDDIELLVIAVTPVFSSHQKLEVDSENNEIDKFSCLKPDYSYKMHVMAYMAQPLCHPL